MPTMISKGLCTRPLARDTFPATIYDPMSYSEAAMPLEDAKFYLRREMSEPEKLALGSGDVVVFTCARRPGRGPNEDAAGIMPIDEQRSVLLVADGMGGTAAGARAAGIVITHTIERLLQVDDGESAVRNAILDGIEESNRRIRGLDVGSGTTILAVEISAGTFRSYHAGDSMAMLVDLSGRPTWRTAPHSPVGHAVEAGLLDETAAMTHENRHLLANAVGKATMHLEIGARRPLRPGDTLVLATDGLFDNLLLEEIAEIARNPDLVQAVEELVATAGNRMISPETSYLSKPDDFTVVAYRERAPDTLGTLEFSPVETG